MVIFQKNDDWEKKEEEEKDYLLTCVASPKVKRIISYCFHHVIITQSCDLHQICENYFS